MIFLEIRFFNDGSMEIKNNELILEKTGFDNDEKAFLLRYILKKTRWY